MAGYSTRPESAVPLVCRVDKSILRSKPITLFLSCVIALLRYVMLMGPVQRWMYFRLYPHRTFGFLYPSQVVYAVLAICMLVMITRFAIVTERRPLFWLISMYAPIVLSGFLAMVFIDGEKIWDAAQSGFSNWIGMSLLSSIIAFPTRWWYRRRRGVVQPSVPGDVDGPVWPPPPSI